MTDGLTDQPTDRHSGLKSRVHVTKELKTILKYMLTAIFSPMVQIHVVSFLNLFLISHFLIPPPWPVIFFIATHHVRLQNIGFSSPYNIKQYILVLNSGQYCCTNHVLCFRAAKGNYLL